MRRLLPAISLLVLVTVAAFWRVGQCGFVNLDDDAYVEAAPMVNKGIRPAAVAWAFTAVHTSNWHPLTTLSHMLDSDLFGVRPAPMHWENLVFHVLNSILVFLVWQAMSGAFWRSWIVAALFAIHPLHVESVAWISERKDVLCTLFWLLGLGAYVRWTRAPTIPRYALVLAALTASLLFKPMAVTFPCTLLLLDFWPLRRLHPRNWTSLVVEKLPLFGLVILHSVITFVVQHSSGAANYAQRFGFVERVGNAFVSYARYLGKTFWPETLTPLYYHPGAWPPLVIAASLLLLTGLSVAVWRWRVRFPWLAFGWAWFAGTLIPVIGIVQVGAQAMADRYTYVPLLGVFTLLAWGGADFVTRHPRLRRGVIAASIIALIACSVLTYRQVGVWRDSITLYRHSIAKGEDNPPVRYLLAVALLAAGRPETEAVEHWQRAVELQSDYANAWTQLALFDLRHGRIDNARQILQQNIRREPQNPQHRFNFAAVCNAIGRTDEAMRYFAEALDLDPKYAAAHREIAQIHAKQNRLAEARVHYAEVVRADRWNALWLAEYGVLLGNLGDLEGARRFLERSAWIDPDNKATQANLTAVDRLRQQKN